MQTKANIDSRSYLLTGFSLIKANAIYQDSKVKNWGLQTGVHKGGEGSEWFQFCCRTRLLTCSDPRGHVMSGRLWHERSGKATEQEEKIQNYENLKPYSYQPSPGQMLFSLNQPDMT